MSHSLRHLGGDRWQCVVFLGRDESGAQRRKSRTFRASGKKDAAKKGTKLEEQLRDEADRIDLTLAQAAEDWWAVWAKRDRSPRTREDYRSILDNHILKSNLARLPVEKIRTGQIERWYASLVEPRDDKSELSASRVKRIHAVLSQVLDQCIKDEHLTVNRAKLSEKPTPRSERRKFVAPEIVARIVAAAYAVHPARGRALAFAGRTGLRRGEMAGLRWSRILEDGGVLVDRAVIEVDGRFVPKKAPRWPANDKGARFPSGRWLVEKDTKAHNGEPILLEQVDMLLLAQQAEWQRLEADAAGVRLGEDAFLWAVDPPFGKPINPDTLTGWHEQACKDAGVSAVRLHDLRHHHASVYLAAGATVEEARQRMRHKSIQTTMGYLEADPGRQRELLARLPRLELGG